MNVPRPRNTARGCAHHRSRRMVRPKERCFTDTSAYAITSRHAEAWELGISIGACVVFQALPRRPHLSVIATASREIIENFWALNSPRPAPFSSMKRAPSGKSSREAREEYTMDRLCACRLCARFLLCTERLFVALQSFRVFFLPVVHSRFEQVGRRNRVIDGNGLIVSGDGLIHALQTF